MADCSTLENRQKLNSHFFANYKPWKQLEFSHLTNDHLFSLIYFLNADYNASPTTKMLRWQKIETWLEKYPPSGSQVVHKQFVNLARQWTEWKDFVVRKKSNADYRIQHTTTLNRNEMFLIFKRHVNVFFVVLWYAKYVRPPTTRPKTHFTRKVMLKKIPIMKSTTLNIAQQNKKSTCLFSFA